MKLTHHALLHIPMAIISILEFIIMIISMIWFHPYCRYILPISLFIYGVISTIIIHNYRIKTKPRK